MPVVSSEMASARDAEMITSSSVMCISPASSWAHFGLCLMI